MKEKQKWNAKYEERLKEITMPIPNQRLTGMEPYLMSGGTALDIACGLGGNSYYLARLGYKVRGIDISDKAIQYVEEQAARNKLNIQAEVRDLTEVGSFQFKANFFDLVVVAYYLDRRLFPSIHHWVKVGGYVFMDTYYHSPKLESQRVSNDFLLQSNELLREFRDWKVLSYEEDERSGRQMIFCEKTK
ncbi:hypothetical protein A8F94_12810 [Bacillus sp. FJAT-27225]|uniref:class I SAM-dependent methyltransferase n=1 Tax=Bacillus sp. FJAT-27225 TaxID=1743144 RepID=UPI00080C2F3E|nr:class I SAM-dependent methyltransferase [Bacillus sp. FJAT-27225]OCA85748.1 hypothetical protein A8F94_12810 [Bacillus sp. FJAT-27225]